MPRVLARVLPRIYTHRDVYMYNTLVFANTSACVYLYLCIHVMPTARVLASQTRIHATHGLPHSKSYQRRPSSFLYPTRNQDHNKPSHFSSLLAYLKDTIARISTAGSVVGGGMSEDQSEP